MAKMEIILSTGNIVSGVPSIVRKPGSSRSNLEFTSSLRDHFAAAQQDYAAAAGGGSSSPDGETPVDIWTTREGNTLYVPRIEWATAGLQEEGNRYDITVKLFFLPGAPISEREQYIKDAVDLVLKELKVDSIDLLIASFPEMSFDGDCEWEADKKNASQGDDDEEASTWVLMEKIHEKGMVKSLGISEFGSEKMQRLMKRINVRPAVDQINIRDCCKVPPPLIKLAKEQKIELLVHTDCTDILPSGTLRELLGHGPIGAGVVSTPEPGENEDGHSGSPELRGDLIPQWVVKYTAVVRDRGVIENKGYFAGAALVQG
ncbi:uncharacterized protein MKZ38_008545 [Zalerion maritima]|uniref:GCS light chain n=1 Tax=Zalerion maritima TaxID=339359 RepID=A0AAD5S2B6_9PEZI|nr:uncharacterized protein MKZ38_008545 [Zalerion maritima]